MRSPALLDNLDQRQRSNICGSQSGCHTGSLVVVLKIIHASSTDATSRQDKAVLDGRLHLNRTAFRLSLSAAAVVASMGLAAAQTPDPHHAGAPAAAMLTMPPQAGMPMPGAEGPAASFLGGDMGRMMEMMRPMMAGGWACPSSTSRAASPT